jgi:hypothetical protein
MMAAAALLIMLGMAPAWAQESFRATHIARLDGESEQPAPILSDGTGIAIMRFDPAAKRLEYRISVSDLADVRAAHFHSGRADTIGPVIHTITLPSTFATNHTVTGVWEGITSQDSLRLMRGTIYINFHTGANPGGEIRGQVDRIPNLVASLSAREETDSVRSDGGGDALIVLDPIAKRLDYLITFGGLTGPARAAHFHRGAKGVAGDVAATIDLGSREGRAAGSWVDISDADMALLLDRKIYINIHTDSNSKGEIRGQVVPIEFYSASISPQNEVVRPTNSQSAGTGYAFVVSEIEAIADFAGEFIIGGTTGLVSSAHIHGGAIGVKGGIIESLEPLNDATGTFWSLPFFTFIEGDSLSLLRSSGAYVNFHTAQWPDGELRGQLIPAQYNLSPVSSVAVEERATAGSMLTASVDRNSGEIGFHIGAEARGSSRSVALYSSIGTRIAEIEVTGDRARMAADGLASGLYFAQLVVDGRPMGVCRVVVAR